MESQNIAQSGSNRAGRIYMHFYACSRNSNVIGGNRFSAGAQAVVIIAATVARGAGSNFSRSANDVISPDRIDGAVPPRFFRATCLLPSYELLRRNEERHWKPVTPIENGNPSECYDSEEEKNAPSTRMYHEEDSIVSRGGWQKDEDWPQAAESNLPTESIPISRKQRRDQFSDVEYVVTNAMGRRR